MLESFNKTILSIGLITFFSFAFLHFSAPLYTGMILHLHLAFDYFNSSSSFNCDYQATVIWGLFERLLGTVKAEKNQCITLSYKPRFFCTICLLNVFEDEYISFWFQMRHK